MLVSTRLFHGAGGCCVAPEFVVETVHGALRCLGCHCNVADHVGNECSFAVEKALPRTDQKLHVLGALARGPRLLGGRTLHFETSPSSDFLLRLEFWIMPSEAEFKVAGDWPFEPGGSPRSGLLNVAKSL
jgi:hypothetical protein